MRLVDLPTLPFSENEYLSRLARTRDAMAANGIDVLYLSDPSNMSWLTGYNAWSFYTHQGVVVSLEDEPIYWGRQQDTNAARRTTWLDDDHIVGYADDFVQSRDRHPMEELARLLRDRGMDTKRLGVELDNYYYSATADRTLRASLGRDDLEDATGLVNWQRTVKSEQELAYMRIAAKIVESAFRRVFDIVRPGMRKNELVAEILYATTIGTPEYGGDYTAIVPLLPSGKDGSASHLTWDDRPMEVGSGTFFELAGCYRRYHSPMSRTVFLGRPPQRFDRAAKALMEGLEAGIDAARAGNRAADVANALNAVMDRYGIDRGGARCGYPIGISFPPDWGERTISFRSTDDTVLEPGMTFHFMPGIWLDDWGIEITETIAITEAGPAECLANVPREVHVLDC